MKPDKCELCGRDDEILNFHHLIPVTLHSKKFFKDRYDKNFLISHGIWICEHSCHREIHKFISEKDMGRKFNTLQLLMNHPKVKKYIEWRKKH